MDDLVLLLEDSTTSSEQNKVVLEMREVLDLCILEKRYRMYSPLSLATGVYFWYARGAQAPWLHFLSSMCPDISEVVDWKNAINVFSLSPWQQECIFVCSISENCKWTSA